MRQSLKEHSISKRKHSNFGVCKLTGDEGTFVKSHIIPKALTKPAYEGGMLFQGGDGRKPQKRRTSWYDQGIVTRKGEDVLANLDSWAIKFLRKNRLVWSGFGPVLSAAIDLDLGHIGGMKGYGVRTIEVQKPQVLRKFCLSLLWRASVSSLPEMHEISLGSKMERKIARYIVDDWELSDEVFPCEMIQHHQVGFIHNQTPVKETKAYPTEYGNTVEIGTYRFYIDGLVLHFGIDANKTTQKIALSEMTAGYSNQLHVTCIPWSKSRENENSLARFQHMRDNDIDIP